MSSGQEDQVTPVQSDTDLSNQMNRLNTAGSSTSFHSTTSTGTVVEVGNAGMTGMPTYLVNKLLKLVDHMKIDSEKPSRKRPRAPEDGPSPNIKRGKPNIQEANLPEYKEARNLSAKLEKYKVTLTTLKKYIGHDTTIIPNQFEIKMKPMIGNDNTDFMGTWNNMIQEMQRTILQKQAEFCEQMVRDLTRLTEEATTKLRAKLSDNAAELQEAEAAIKTVANRVKATEYTKLQGRWSRDIGTHESQKMGIPVQKPKNPQGGKQNGKNNNARNQPNKDNKGNNNDR